MVIVERIQFKLILTPCCGHLFCWVNPRYPTFCPQCGTQIFTRVKECIQYFDDDAELHFMKRVDV